MATCDVLIVGGGPAGSACAWRLRQAGLDVMVADASTFPRDKVCAGWITPQAVTALRLDTEAYAERTHASAVHRISGRPDRRRDATTGRVRPSRELRHPPLRVRSLSAAARRRSARRSACRSRACAGTRGEWIVNDAIRAPLLVGAGGSGCPVARMMNGAARDRPLVVAREAESRVGAAELEAIAIEPDVPELFFCRDLQGYGWCVRKGEYLNVGLGRLDPRSLPAATQQLRRLPRGDAPDPAAFSVAMARPLVCGQRGAAPDAGRRRRAADRRRGRPGGSAERRRDPAGDRIGPARRGDDRRVERPVLARPAGAVRGRRRGPVCRRAAVGRGRGWCPTR